ncbi:PEP-CTERM sorting domain-containing protein [Pontiellaceae bacterium B12227]|nr:PEP-CTERM sorting domain-containing protein [Pontiellaceae bacterium B12227]
MYKKVILPILILSAAHASADFSISLNFASGVEESYKSAFNDAASFWETQITGYRFDDINLQGINISANVATNDGVGGTLGSAGPTSGYVFNGIVLDGDASPSDVLYSTAGSMTFDSADVDNLIAAGSWETVIRHEMAHVIGFGTLWGFENGGTTYNDFYINGSGQYTGTAGLAAYQAEFDSGATYVPVELGGGDGTANGHWNEIDGGAGLTGITDGSGNDMANELMTGWLNSPSYVSNTTLGQFYDMGYSVIPEPSSILLVALFGSVGFWIRRQFLI